SGRKNLPVGIFRRGNLATDQSFPVEHVAAKNTAKLRVAECRVGWPRGERRVGRRQLRRQNNGLPEYREGVLRQFVPTGLTTSDDIDEAGRKLTVDDVADGLQNEFDRGYRNPVLGIDSELIAAACLGREQRLEEIPFAFGDAEHRSDTQDMRAVERGED